MQRLIAWIQAVLVPTLGPAGLFLVAFLDSSFLSIPEVNDILVITAAITDARTAWVPVLMATLGSLAGCLTLYFIGARGGEALLVKRFGEEQTRRARAAFDRYEILTLAAPAMLPPPMPFKIFVLAAGVFAVPLRKFVITLFLARGLRYTLWAVLGMVYREQALAFLKAVDAWGARNGPWLLGLLVTFSLAAAGYWLWLRGGRVRAADPVSSAGAS